MAGVADGGIVRSKEGSRGDSEVDDGVLALDFESESRLEHADLPSLRFGVGSKEDRPERGVARSELVEEVVDDEGFLDEVSESF